MYLEKQITTKILCYHCGNECDNSSIFEDDKCFCCAGCRNVYDILNNNNLCAYYNIEKNPGVAPELTKSGKYDFLDDPDTVFKLLQFTDDKYAVISLNLPQIHCSSCIWLLENLFKINPGIVSSNVNFIKKEIKIKFLHKNMSIKEIIILLANLGYTPLLNLNHLEPKKENQSFKSIYFKIALAAFSFGNIMLFSFPEYLGIPVTDTFFKSTFNYLNLILSIPVLLYSAKDYFTSAYKSLKNKFINIDFPLSLGIAALFLRSAYEVLSGTGAGYFDSFTGLVFFLLIGKYLQERTYNYLDFEKNYKSFFPISVMVMKDHKPSSVSLDKIQVGDRILIHKDEVIPTDSILISKKAVIDYSFITGESLPVYKKTGAYIYAGGRQTDLNIELEVVKEVSQSYLSSLWNNNIFKKQDEGKIVTFTNKVSKYFTIVILFIAFVSSSIWLTEGIDKALFVFTSVLIVACPCALSLSIPFTFGNTLKIFAENKFFLKNTNVVQKFAEINEIVFDKTGTITQAGSSAFKFYGRSLSEIEKQKIATLVLTSNNTLGKGILDIIGAKGNLNVQDFQEYEGVGVKGKINGDLIKIGLQKFISEDIVDDRNGINIYVSINDDVLGYFKISNIYRKNILNVLSRLNKNYRISILSGDNENEKENLKKYIDKDNLLFNQKPEDKLSFINSLSEKGKKVLMVGDGLNDAGALKVSYAGISVTDDISRFSPSCDGILDSSMLFKLYNFLSYSGMVMKIIYFNLTISIMYNLIGLYFAVNGKLSPIISAVLMPLSSISVIIVAVVFTNLFRRKYKL